MWSLYKRQPGIVLGFHGCDRSVGEAVLSEKQTHLKASQNDYDWLGNGIYFWEGDPARALAFAKQAAKPDAKISKGDIRDPFVVGAIIDLGVCCNLAHAESLAELRKSYDTYALIQELRGEPLLENKGHDQDLTRRFLDRAVFEFMHEIRIASNVLSGEEILPAYDTIRSPFWEGEKLYPGAGFTEKAHIQIAVRSTKNILGYFRPLETQRTPR